MAPSNISRKITSKDVIIMTKIHKSGKTLGSFMLRRAKHSASALSLITDLSLGPVRNQTNLGMGVIWI